MRKASTFKVEYGPIISPSPFTRLTSNSVAAGDRGAKSSSPGFSVVSSGLLFSAYPSPTLGRDIIKQAEFSEYVSPELPKTTVPASENLLSLSARAGV